MVSVRTSILGRPRRLSRDRRASRRYTLNCEEPAIDYKQYLASLLDAAEQLGSKRSDQAYPEWVHNGAQRALVDFHFTDPAHPIQVDFAIRTSKPHNWVGNAMKEKVVRRAVAQVLPDGFDRLDELFDLVKARDEYR